MAVYELFGIKGTSRKRRGGGCNQTKSATINQTPGSVVQSRVQAHLEKHPKGYHGIVISRAATFLSLDSTPGTMLLRHGKVTFRNIFTLALIAAASIIVCLTALQSRRASHYISFINPLAQQAQLAQEPHEPPILAQSLKERITFWTIFQPILSSNRPQCPSPQRNGSSDAIAFNASKETSRLDLTLMPADDVNLMRQAHGRFVDMIRDNNTIRLPYVDGTRGIVTTAGGQYLPVLVISLRMLRKTGSTLPVEVFLASTVEYEGDLCDRVLPELNAKCVILSDVLDAVQGSVTIQHYQLKCFSMLFSSFEDILFLDADSFPIHDPDMLFTAAPFMAYGMTTWPDFWASTTSPYYYNISSQPVPPMSARQSTEAGEVLLSKRYHGQTLLLATYYNYYGPSHYYVLQSQGAPGEGDKETFVLAATALRKPFYQVSERVRPIGIPKLDGGVAGSAMIQYDPIEDYGLTQQGLWRIKNPKVAESPRPFFVHANFPKFNPATIFHEGGPTQDPMSRSDRRAWTAGVETLAQFGFDIERSFWEEIRWTACQLEDTFRSWRKEFGICERVEVYWMNVFATPRERILAHHESNSNA